MNKKKIQQQPHMTRRQKLAKKLAESKDLVDKANAQVDPLEKFTEFHQFKTKDNLDVKIQCKRVKDLPSETISWIFDLMDRNMKNIYERTSWGWDEEAKHKELTDPASWHLIATLQDKPVGFSHFRYDIDNSVEVLYCYELQLEPHLRRKGVGRFMLHALERLAAESLMQKVILTVFKLNSSAKSFYENNGYKLDITNPSAQENQDYVIMSKTKLPTKNG